MTGFIQMPKGFKNLLKLDLENQFRKLKRDSYSFPFLPPFWPVGPFPFSPLAFPLSLLSPLLGWAVSAGNRRCRSLPFSRCG
jgi:hypothetical protein